MHTKGPWRVGDAGHTVFGPPNGNLSPAIIANVGRGAFASATVKANARLIAACPTMADYVIRKAIGGDKDAETIARSFGWNPA